MTLNGPALSLALSVFLASAVESVEAFTIVLAVSQTRRASSALAGSAAALLALALVTALLGPALTGIPIRPLRLVVGGLLLAFGLQWLRQAILRAGGVRAHHDEGAIFAVHAAEASSAPGADGFDGYAFAICFKAVALEGLEVVFIVLTFGANQHDVGLAALAATAAAVVVLAAGLMLRAPLAGVPENTMKLAVGVVLTAFGIFWGAEGVGASWPGGEAALPFLVALVALCSLASIRRVGALVAAERLD
jgi:uncharacterized membrane protein